VHANTSRAFSPACDVAVGHDRNAQRRLHRAHGVVFRLAAVALLARAAVHRDHLHAGLLGRTRDHQRIALRLAPAGAHLERHRHGAVRRQPPPHR
jgi:hypothetical protein